MSRTRELGELIDKLKRMDLTLPVYFDNGQHPTDIDSWRGIYSELALSHEVGGEPLTGGALLEILEGAIDKTFTGYKGGDYVMTADTPVWVDNYGCYSCNTITGMKQENGRIIILTAIEGDED